MQHKARHIGIIPDGNRRWATQNGLRKEIGYDHGLQPGLRLLRAAKQRGIKEITYYGFTVDNCKRPKEQFEAFKNACCNAVKLIEKEDVSLYVCGNTKSNCFPSQLLPYTVKKDSPEDKMKVNFLVNYGWEWDIKNGWLSHEIPRIDMVIRWGGMRRLSGFLPLQTVYSDFYVIDDLWPTFQEKHLDDALEWYVHQDVTLGG
ncbi:MAG: undecaprenyl diphosphate synthase family protein [Clostridia bacterium]|nr:undecaprenyl diphosphate synthase family protein [Clostridia bacterium]MDE6758665.1 undecaprenyl diphosphate synthase family protein [Clostridia bacterium]MDE7078947.1 undecaprenyl diphosphate synthase family protein [Clostridia bacterium]